MEDIITAKPTTKVTSELPNARWMKAAAPPARGYFVTNSA